MESPTAEDSPVRDRLAERSSLDAVAAADQPSVSVVRNPLRVRKRTTAEPSDQTKKLLPWLVAVAFFMESLDITILNTAVPTIAASMGVPPLSLKAALTSYTLSLAIFIPVSGWVADRFGTRRVFSSAIGIFMLGSLACGLSTNLPMLVAARLVQGIGGAMMMPVGRITIVRTFPKSEMVRAMSFVAIPGLLGPLLGPLSGGLIVTFANWRTIFLINLPIGLLGLYAVLRFLPDYRSPSVPKLDRVGFVLFGAGIALLSYVLEVFGEHTLSTPAIAALLVFALLLLLAYWRHAGHTEHPLLQMSLFKLRTFRAAVAGGFVTRLGIGGMPFLLPLFYQVGLGYSAVASGLMIMPQPLAAMTLKVMMPKILARFGYRRVLVSNTVAIGFLIAIFATDSQATPIWLIVVLQFALGFFSSLQFTSMNTLVFADVAPTETSGASALSSAMQQLSISFGIAVASLVVALFLQARHGAPEAVATAIRHTFIALGAVTVVSSLVFHQLKPQDGASISRG
ncbi:MFS transporter [Opitutaceae bacterium EW11]|nr:MFS transporter [Opitutaceae bacterium EW11]